jgi:hypothetical protein
MSNESIITILIAGHGIEMYDEPLSEPNVRILSLAGKPFCFSFIKTEVDGTTTGSRLMDNLIDEFNNNPNKNTLHIMSDFTKTNKHIYDETIDFSSDYFSNLNPEPNMFKHGSLNKEGTMRLLTVQNEKQYQIKMYHPDKLMYGIYVINTRNSPNNLNLEPKTKLSVPVFSLETNEKPYLYNYIQNLNDKSKIMELSYLYGKFGGYEIMLSDIIRFFKRLGYTYINIIDTTCRVSQPTFTDPITDRLIRRVKRREQGPMTELMSKSKKRKLEEMPGGGERRKKRNKKTKKRYKK